MNAFICAHLVEGNGQREREIQREVERERDRERERDVEREGGGR